MGISFLCRAFFVVVTVGHVLCIPAGGPYASDPPVCTPLGDEYASDEVVMDKVSDGYAAQTKAHWSQTAWNSPGCIFLPKTTADVVEAVKALGATSNPFAVRGGGHSPLPGWASIGNKGLLISMRGVSDMTYDAATQTARVGFGSTWGEVYDFLALYNRTAVGGRARSVGLGFLTGGGLSHLSNAYGFGSDNVVSYELVLANASTITVSADANPDLFYALKAGSNNYGIITHVVLRTYPSRGVWAGTLVFSTDDHRDQLMAAFATYQSSGQLDTRSALLAYLGINNNTAYVSLMYLDDGISEHRPAAFQPFYDIPALADTTRYYDDFGSAIAPQVDYVVPRWTWGATTFFMDNETYVEVGQIAQNATVELSKINGGTMVLMPQPISKTMIGASQKRGDSPMQLRNREQMWFCINIGWNFEADDAAIGRILMDTLAQIETVTKAKNLYDPFIFQNDAYYLQDPIGSYGADSVTKMRNAATKYDPEQMFQTQMPGGFKLRNVKGA